MEWRIESMRLFSVIMGIMVVMPKRKINPNFGHKHKTNPATVSYFTPDPRQVTILPYFFCASCLV